MRLRSFIRILLLLPFLFVTAWWIISYFRVTGVTGNSWFLYGKYNSIYLVAFDHAGGFATPGLLHSDIADFNSFSMFYDFDFLGFGRGQVFSSFYVSCTRIPFWFPTVLSAILIFVAWRLQRTPKPGKAFPMDSHHPAT